MSEPNRLFTSPAELHKAINTLRGIVAGLGTDAAVSSKEIAALSHWCLLHAHLRDRHPFSEILPVVETVCADGTIDDDAAKDILWVCSSFADSGSYYNEVTSSIQFLSGMIHGLLADAELSDSEINALDRWIRANEFLAGTYPYDEINSLLREVLRDRRIDADERELLLAFFSSLIEYKDSLNLAAQDSADLREKYSRAGICAHCPKIRFAEKSFCFTGESQRATLRELIETVQQLGGSGRSSVSPSTDYLVVGNAGSACWAYACYGRRIEEAVRLRRAGGKIVLVSETDFWNAVDAAQSGRA